MGTSLISMQSLARVTNLAAPRVLSACGRTTSVRASGGGGYGRGAEHNKNIVWSEALLKPEQRSDLLNTGHQGATLWMSGLSGSGKSTIAAALEQELLEMGAYPYRLDGDNVRFGLNKDLGFSEADRDENIRRTAEISALFTDAGAITLTSFISPYKKTRDMARAIHEDAGHTFIEVHVHVPLEEAEARDPKGLYVKGCVGALVHELKARGVISGQMKINKN